MAEFVWDVFVPGEDLPHRLATDYIVSEGEEITVDGRVWLVESVTLRDPGDVEDPPDPTSGSVSVVGASGLVP